MLSVKDVKNKVDAFDKNSDLAGFLLEVIKSIAEGSANPKGLAREALKVFSLENVALSEEENPIPEKDPDFEEPPEEVA